jgi:probable rRNA maturation factor
MPTKNTLTQIKGRYVVQSAVTNNGVPGSASLRKWARAAGSGASEVTVRVVGAAEGRRLNRLYRRKDRPTNVLSFPYGRSPLRGDIVLCHPVITREARAQGKSLRAHYAHLVVHGMLHLRGHDHGKKEQALRMEKAEIRILGRFGFPDPYRLEEGGRRGLR